MWKEFCEHQSENEFSYQLVRHEAVPMVQATRRAQISLAWYVYVVCLELWLFVDFSIPLLTYSIFSGAL